MYTHYRSFGECQMKENRERWMELAKLAADEQNPEKLLELVREINRPLLEKQKRLNEQPRSSKPDC